MSERKDIEKFDLKPKEVLLVRLDDRYNAQQVNKIIQKVSKIVNENAQEDDSYMNPVLFMDKSVELETLPIDQLEDILEQAKSISEKQELNQEEIEVEEREREERIGEEEIDSMHEELKDLIPRDKKDE